MVANDDDDDDDNDVGDDHSNNNMIIALKGAVSDFHSLLTAQRTVSNTYAEVAMHNRVQITCYTSCNMSCAMWYEGAAQLIKSDRAEFTFILALFHWLKLMKD